MGMLLLAAGAYLLGCVPAARFVQRLLGERWWTPWAAYAGNACKGALAVLVLSPVGPWGQALSATAVVSGHLWPITGTDDGDTGLSVAAGALTVVSPIAVPVWAVTWALLYVISGYMTVGAAAATVFFAPALGYWAGWPIGIISLPACVMVLERLRPALRRVLLGTEQRHLWRTRT